MAEKMRVRATTVLMAVWLSSSGVAWADVTAADRATARTLAQEGQDALDAKRYAAAAERFARADALVHAPTLLLGLARAQLGQGKLVEALENYNRIVREGVAPNSPKSWSKAYESATTEVESIAPRIPWVTITVLGPTAPEVVIDTSPVPPASLGVKRPVNPGPHVIKVSAEGFVPAEKSLNLAEGQSVQVPFELQQAATPAIATTGVTPTLPADNGPPQSTGSAQTTLGIVALGIGGAGLITGGVTGILAIRKNHQLDDICKLPDHGCGDPEPGGLNPSGPLSNYHTLATVATTGFIVGGVGIAAGVILLLTRPHDGASTSTGYVSPYFAGNQAGVVGAF
jgi:hypothetical protein